MLSEKMDKAQIVAVLQSYNYDINRIVALIPQGSGAARDAQSTLKRLKSAIHNDYKHRHTIVHSTPLTEAEQASLERAIRDVFFAVQAIGVNSNPSAEWRNALFDADMDIQRCVAELNGSATRTEAVSAVSEDWI